jgi:hypothetical protein
MGNPERYAPEEGCLPQDVIFAAITLFGENIG